MIYHLSPTGKIAMVMANGSMSSQTNNEGEIRKKIINADLVEAMISLPAQLFANVQIPACIWILNKRKTRKGEVLFIDARQIGYMKTPHKKISLMKTSPKSPTPITNGNLQKITKINPLTAMPPPLLRLQKMILC